MHTACEPRTAYGHSPYSVSVRTKTADSVTYTSSLVPIVSVNTAYTACFRGRFRGSIPLGSTIKRLVRRGSGKANGQKPKMYGHADRIGGQDKDSRKLPALLDRCVLTAYSCPMTTSERDELARDIFVADNCNTPEQQVIQEWASAVNDDKARLHGYAYNIADGLIAKGYGKLPEAGKDKWAKFDEWLAEA